jgi:hypothetical protein
MAGAEHQPTPLTLVPQDGCRTLAAAVASGCARYVRSAHVCCMEVACVYVAQVAEQIQNNILGALCVSAKGSIAELLDQICT